MTQVTENKWLLATAALLTGWLGWLSLQVMSINQQVATISITQRDVIPPVVEYSLREIRSDARADRELVATLSKIVEGNRVEIAFLRDAIKSKP